MRLDPHFGTLPERAFRSLGGRMTLEGGGKGGSAPPAPDYAGAAAAQGQSAKENIASQTWANRPTMNTPWGQMSWGTTPGTDPGTGVPITQWTGNLALDPESQRALGSQQRVTSGRSGAAETLLGQATGSFQKPADWGALPEFGTLKGQGYDPQGARNRSEQALFQRQIGMIEPGLTQSEDARRTRLANMGISPEGGSEAWNRAQQGMDATRSKAYSDAALSSIAGGGAEAQRELQLAGGASDYMNKGRQQAIAEMAQQRGMPLNELNALLTGQQVSMPQQPGFQAAQAAAATPFLGAAQAQGNFGLDAAKMNQDSGPDIGTLLGTAAKVAPLFMASDRRLKKNIMPLRDGWYAFQYIGDTVMRIGVMAQDLLKTNPAAVSMNASGFLMVDYSKL
jgi:hypothetical protein